MRPNALFASVGEYSTPMPTRLGPARSVAVVPLPLNGSSTALPSFEHARMTRSR